MNTPINLEINGIDPVTVAAVDLIIQTLPNIRLRLVDSRRVSVELTHVLSGALPFPRRSQALRARLDQHFPDVRYCSSDSPIDLAIVASESTYDHGRCDVMMHADTPHLLTLRNEKCWEIGPLVIPGRTCCARCIEVSSSRSPATDGLPLSLWRLSTPLPWLTHMAASWLSLMVYDCARFGVENTSCVNRFLRISDSGEVSWHELRTNDHCGCRFPRLSNPLDAAQGSQVCEEAKDSGKFHRQGCHVFDLLSHNRRYPLAS